MPEDVPPSRKAEEQTPSIADDVSGQWARVLLAVLAAAIVGAGIWFQAEVAINIGSMLLGMAFSYWFGAK